MANEVMEFALTNDPDQVCQALNAAFDGTTQTALKAGEAITGPSASGGFFYFAGEAPYSGTAIQRISEDSDSGSWLTVGPTGSGATVIWNVLDSVPSGAKAIKINGVATAAGSVGNYISCKVRKNGSSINPGEFLYAYTLVYEFGQTRTSYCYNTVDVQLDSNRKFQFYWNKSGINLDLLIQLEGWYI
jgi:hypothetical protein